MKQIQNFLVETWKRLKGKMPAYFQVIAWITGLYSALVEVPAWLVDFNTQTGFNITLPHWYNVLLVIAKFTIGLFVGAHLAIQRITLPNSNGIIEGATHAELPFTAKKEEGQIISQEEGK